jgi:hypothetical protein
MCISNKKDKNAPTYLMSQEFKDYTLFEEGSRWIYQLENSVEKDTVIQVYREYKMIDSRDFGYNTDQYLTRSSSSYFKDMVITIGGLDYDNVKISRLRLFYESQLLIESRCFFDNVGIKVGERFHNLIYEDFKESYKLGNITFNNVKVFNNVEIPRDENTNFSNIKLPKVTYYAKNVGLIRKELWNGQVWNLVDYKVSQ